MKRAKARAPERGVHDASAQSVLAASGQFVLSFQKGLGSLTLELEFVEFLVNAAAFDQLRVFAGFHDASLVEHHDEIGPLHRGKPVRDANRGATGHELLEGGLHGAFGLGIERAHGLVQHQNRRIFQNGAGDGDTLALAAGKVHAFFADDRLVAVRLF